MSARTRVAIVAACAASALVGATVGALMVQRGGEARADSLAQVPKVITAQTFVVVDANGKARVVLGTTDTGEPKFVLADRVGKKRLVASVTNANIAVVTLTGSDEQPALSFAALANGDGAIQLGTTKSGDGVATIAVDGGKGQLTINGKDLTAR